MSLMTGQSTHALMVNSLALHRHAPRGSDPPLAAWGSGCESDGTLVMVVAQWAGRSVSAVGTGDGCGSRTMNGPQRGPGT